MADLVDQAPSRIICVSIDDDLPWQLCIRVELYERLCVHNVAELDPNDWEFPIGVDMIDDRGGTTQWSPGRTGR